MYNKRNECELHNVQNLMGDLYINDLCTNVFSGRHNKNIDNLGLEQKVSKFNEKVKILLLILVCLYVLSHFKSSDALKKLSLF